jgi:hypothetical protein
MPARNSPGRRVSSRRGRTHRSRFIAFFSSGIPHESYRTRVARHVPRNGGAGCRVHDVLKKAGGRLDNVVAMTVFIKETRYGNKFVEMRKDFFKNGNYPGSALITVTNFARPGIEIEIQAVGVISDTCSNDHP